MKLLNRWSLFNNKTALFDNKSTSEVKLQFQFHKNFTVKSRETLAVKIFISNELTEEMDSLRLKCFSGSKPVSTSRDQFDNRSQHIAISIKQSIAAYGRLTSGPNAVFEHWTHGKAKIPTGKHVMDLGRCLVNPEYRSLGLFELICLLGLKYSMNLGYTQVVGSYVQGEKVGPKLHKIGFDNAGDPVQITEPFGNQVILQPVSCELSKKQYLWLPILKEKVIFLKTKGYLLSELEPEIINDSIKEQHKFR